MHRSWAFILMLMVLTLSTLSAEAESVTFSAEVIHPQDERTSFVVEVVDQEKSTGKVRRVLIYHTHTYEAYEQTADAPYPQTEKWRTTDNEHNVVAVGEALTASLRAAGIQVEHDKTAFEPPNMDDAYSRSLHMLEERLAKGEEYDLYIDLHRDALASTSTIARTVNIAGQDVARFMLLIGKGTTGGYDIKPDWEANLAIANSITLHLNQYHASLARNVKIKTGRFNQHIDDCCILIECGMNTNTLEEVLAGIPYLADAIAQTLLEKENPTSSSDAGR